MDFGFAYSGYKSTQLSWQELKMETAASERVVRTTDNQKYKTLPVSLPRIHILSKILRPLLRGQTKKKCVLLSFFLMSWASESKHGATYFFSHSKFSWKWSTYSLQEAGTSTPALKIQREELRSDSASLSKHTYEQELTATSKMALQPKFSTHRKWLALQASSVWRDMRASCS